MHDAGQHYAHQMESDERQGQVGRDLMQLSNCALLTILTCAEFEVMAEPLGRSSRSAGTRGVEGGQRSGALVGSKCHDAGDNRSSEHQEQRDYHRPAGGAMIKVSLCSKMNEIDEIGEPQRVRERNRRTVPGAVPQTPR